jgi:hypothetical protein
MKITPCVLVSVCRRVPENRCKEGPARIRNRAIEPTTTLNPYINSPVQFILKIPYFGDHASKLLTCAHSICKAKHSLIAVYALQNVYHLSTLHQMTGCALVSFVDGSKFTMRDFFVQQFLAFNVEKPGVLLTGLSWCVYYKY